jgi:hypothetical protein
VIMQILAALSRIGPPATEGGGQDLHDHGIT